MSTEKTPHTTTLFLPFPPSTNTLFSGKARRFKSDAYKKWIIEAQADIDAQKYVDGFKWKNHKGKVELSLALKAPDERRRECSNYIQAVEDLLVANGIIQGDDYRYVRSVHVFWHDMVNSGCFLIIKDVDM
jgi:hypothetical protein